MKSLSRSRYDYGEVFLLGKLIGVIFYIYIYMSMSLYKEMATYTVWDAY